MNPLLAGKSEHTISLYAHFEQEFHSLGDVEFIPAKTMTGVSNGEKRIAWVTQLGKNFIHVVFPFDRPFEDNLCFQKIGQVPGTNQFNHHFRMLSKDDLNDEVRDFMRMSLGK